MKSSLFILLLFFVSVYYGQVRVENSQTAEFYVKNVLLGRGIEVANIKHIGMIGGLGQFEGDPKIIGVKSGIVLTTGNVDSIAKPNNSGHYTSEGKFPESKQLIKELRRGDKDLNRLCWGKTKDITVIEFDFVPVKNSLEFNYVFASEEYPEYVGSSFNDVFGFFLSGPGIKRKVNLAVLPGTKTPISVNNINSKKNKKYYIRNNGRKNKIYSSDQMQELKKQLQFDGMTRVLKVHYDVIPYKKYHIKIAIGDVADNSLDSGVFLEAGSFVSVIDTSGKYYDKVEIAKDLVPNIDSILSLKMPVDTIEQPIINEHFEITDIYFDHGSDVVIDSCKAQLNGLAGYLSDHKTFKCLLYGYSDNTGSKTYNQKLSEKRAMNVINYLIAQGIDGNRLDYQGRNFENPKFDNSTDDGRARNRRVEIVIEETAGNDANQ